MNEETLCWLGGPAGYNQLYLVVNGDRRDLATIRDLTQAVERLLERNGHPVLQTYVTPPLQHPAEALLPVVTVLMTIVDLLALVASSFLSINTISAILNQQTYQLGVMAAIGAGPRTLALMDTATAALFGLLALVLAVRTGLLATQGYAVFLGGQLNIDLRAMWMSHCRYHRSEPMTIPLLAVGQEEKLIDVVTQAQGNSVTEASMGLDIIDACDKVSAYS